MSQRGACRIGCRGIRTGSRAVAGLACIHTCGQSSRAAPVVPIGAPPPCRMLRWAAFQKRALGDLGGAAAAPLPGEPSRASGGQILRAGVRVWRWAAPALDAGPVPGLTRRVSDGPELTEMPGQPIRVACRVAVAAFVRAVVSS